jgi:diaminobutyrate-2-oxoglutarate transaminase
LAFWQTPDLAEGIEERTVLLNRGLRDIVAHYPDLHADIRGRGLIQGLRVPEPGLAETIAATAFARGLLIETAGADNDVIKALPPLTIDLDDLAQGLDILKAAVAEQLDQRMMTRRGH